MKRKKTPIKVLSNKTKKTVRKVVKKKPPQKEYLLQPKPEDFTHCNGKSIFFKNLVSRYKDNAILFWDSVERRLDIFIIKSRKNPEARNCQERSIGGKKYYGLSLCDTLGYGGVERVNEYLATEFKMLS